MQTPTTPARNAALPDPFFPTIFFAKVPAEAFVPSKFSPDSAMSHAEFRVFVSLCRFRGIERVVNPTRQTLQKMTLMTPNNISRATAGLQKKGWLVIHYLAGSKSRAVANYELGLPGTLNKPADSPKGTSKPRKGETGGVAVAQADKPSNARDHAHTRATEGAEVNNMTAQELRDALSAAEINDEFQYSLALEDGF